MATATVSTAALAGLADFFTKWQSIHSGTAKAPIVEATPRLEIQLKEFFTAWAERPNALLAAVPAPATRAVQLESFFAAWPPLESPTESQPPARVIDWSARLFDMTRFFEDLRPALLAQAEQRRMGSAINVWEASGLGWDELRNSKVLAWLLDCRGTHGQGSRILAALLECVPQDTRNLPTPETADLPYWTHIESCPLGERESRVDIEIDGEGLLLFIEVKIRAVETSDQLDRYLEIANAKARGRPWGLVYLTRHGALPSRFAGPQADLPLVPVSWSDVASVIKRHCETLPDCLTRSVLRQLIEHIRSFC